MYIRTYQSYIGTHEFVLLQIPGYPLQKHSHFPWNISICLSRPSRYALRDDGISILRKVFAMAGYVSGDHLFFCRQRLCDKPIIGNVFVRIPDLSQATDSDERLILVEKEHQTRRKKKNTNEHNLRKVHTVYDHIYRIMHIISVINICTIYIYIHDFIHIYRY